MNASMPAAEISVVLSVANAGPGQDHVVSLAVQGQGVPGLQDATASAALPGGIAEGLIGDTAAIGECLQRSTPRRQRISAGERLATAVLCGEVAELWARTMKLSAGRHRLRFRLDVQPPQLRALPWELLRADGKWAFLEPHISAWRGSELQLAADPDTGPLRVLLIVCNPLDYRVMADNELAMITGELAGRLGQTFVEILDGPDRRRLSREIDRLRPHILHFIGHGMPRIEDNDPELSFNWIPDQPVAGENGGQLWSLYSYDVAQLSEWKPRLVVINACRTAGDPLDSVGGFAEAFLDAGTRAVIAMQADIESPAAVLFSTALYKGLGDFAPLDTIVSQARRRLSMDFGENGEWALPVLAANTDPASALRVCFARKASTVRISDRHEYGQLRGFLDRSTERRAAWWALDPQPEQAPQRPVLVIRGRPVNESKAGKTWFTRWCLLTCFLRGHRVTYVDLAKPLSPPAQAHRPVSSGPSKDWLGVIRAIREACVDARQLQPLPSETFGQFNASLNALVAGRPLPVGANGGDLEPEDDKWQSLNSDRRHDTKRIQRVCAEFLVTLRQVSAGCPHIIALDGVDVILPQTFDQFIYPDLIRPVAEDMQSVIRLVVVGSDEWLVPRLPEDDEKLWTSVSLGGFDPAQFMRLAREYCQRLGLDAEKALVLYKAREQFYNSLGTVPLDAFPDAIKGIPRTILASTA
jgi:hypothetical protein